MGEYVDMKTGRTSDREAFQRLFQHSYKKRFDLCLFCREMLNSDLLKAKTALAKHVTAIRMVPEADGGKSHGGR